MDQETSVVPKNAKASVVDTPTLTAYERWELPSLGEGTAKSVWDDTLKRTREKKDLQPPTVEEIEQIRKGAYEEGFESGKADGYNTGLGQGEAENKQKLDAELAKLGQVLHALMEPIEKQEDDIEIVLVSLVEKISMQLLRRELNIDSSQTKVLVREALGFFKTGKDVIKVYLNAQDETQIREYLESQDQLDHRWQLVPHANLSPGGCILESANSLIDASFDSRFQAIVKQVYDKEISVMQVDKADQDDVIPKSLFTPLSVEETAPCEAQVSDQTHDQISDEATGEQYIEAEDKIEELPAELNQELKEAQEEA